MTAENDSYIPPNLIKSVPIFYAVDNIDFDEDTADGKHTLHGTVVVAFQALNTAADHSGFHEFTGCDITGRFAGKGKKSCWKAFEKASTRVVMAFGNLGLGQWPSDEDHYCVEEFVCRLYHQNTKETSVSRLRWNMFKQSQAEAERLPPTPAALRQHTLRAHYQCMIWCRDTVPIVDLPEPTAYGWRCTDGRFTAIVTDLKPAPEAIVDLVRCKCSTGRCHGNCSCLVAGMACTQMCRCDAHPENCDNVDPVLHNSDGEDDDDQAVYHFPYYSENTDSVLASISGVHEDEDVDNIVHLSEMEVDCADMQKCPHFSASVSNASTFLTVCKYDF